MRRAAGKSFLEFHHRRCRDDGSRAFPATALRLLAASWLGAFLAYSQPISLVQRADLWHYHLGTNAPPALWQTLPEAELDVLWPTAPGGFGYANNAAETADCATLLPGMSNQWSTLYLRRSFSLAEAPATNVHLFLRVDWDDAFLAWLDGRFVAGRNQDGSEVEPPFDSLAASGHESSRGNSSPQPAETIDLGLAAALLAPGTHTLALMGLNQPLNSSDFILVADLYLEAVIPPDPNTNVVSGAIPVDAVWRAALSPYFVAGTVTVTAGATLTIEPGVTVGIAPGASLLVDRGRLLAEGTEAQPIRFEPHTHGSSWSQIAIRDSPLESRIAWAVIDGAATRGNVQGENTALHLDHVTFTNTNVQLVTVDNTSVVLQHCVFPSIQNDELVHFLTMPADGHALIASNWFGTTTGYNDIIDFTGGNRPGPVACFLGNVFTAGVDDCFDMDGCDAHIEGNLFLNVREDADRASTSNPISTGADGGNTSELVVVRNLFFNCDHALLLKDRGAVLFQNNTVVRLRDNPNDRAPASVINFYEARSGTTPGDTAIVRGNILWDVTSNRFALHYTNDSSKIVFEQNLFPTLDLPFPIGAGNLTNDPLFVGYAADTDPEAVTPDNIRSRLALQPGSPAIGSGPDGLDLGALVPGGIRIRGEPSGSTTNTSATLSVTGPGIYAYRWRLDNGPWSEEIPLTNGLRITTNLFADAQPVVLTRLPPGSHTLYAVGMNSAGYWQSISNPTASRSWMVIDPAEPDTDGDGMPDSWEQANDLQPGDPGDRDLDADADGLSNLGEYLAGTDPHDPGSTLRLEALRLADGLLVLQFHAVSNRAYELQCREALAEGTWLVLTNRPSSAGAGDVVVTDPEETTASSRYYRLVIPAP